MCIRNRFYLFFRVIDKSIRVCRVLVVAEVIWDIELHASSSHPATSLGIRGIGEVGRDSYDQAKIKRNRDSNCASQGFSTSSADCGVWDDSSDSILAGVGGTASAFDRRELVLGVWAADELSSATWRSEMDIEESVLVLLTFFENHTTGCT